MMLEASVGGAAPGEFNEDLDHDAKAALVKCFIQAVSVSIVAYPVLCSYHSRSSLSSSRGKQSLMHLSCLV